MRTLSVLSSLLLALTGSLLARDAAIQGEYLEVRTADVWTGPCFANGEVNLTGKEAILAWRVSEWEWHGVPLHGLSVVAVLKANATLGDPFADPLPIHSVIVVDEKADQAQRGALVDFARSMAGELLRDVASVKTAPVEMEVLEREGFARLRAGDIAEAQTRALGHHDTHCGNEAVYYPPLTEVAASPAFTQIHRFSGEGLGSIWSSPDKRSAFVGTFTR